jgi:hypothetical protein
MSTRPALHSALQRLTLLPHAIARPIKDWIAVNLPRQFTGRCLAILRHDQTRVNSILDSSNSTIEPTIEHEIERREAELVKKKPGRK